MKLSTKIFPAVISIVLIMGISFLLLIRGDGGWTGKKGDKGDEGT